MLRALLVLLLLANAGFYAWTQGWLAPWWPPRSEAREPERLAQQIRPEWIKVLSVGAARDAVASAAPAASAPAPAADAEPPPVCLEAGPFSDPQAAAIEAQLAQQGVPDGAVTRELVARTYTWGVVMGRFADREAMRAKAEELRRLNVRTEELTRPPSLVPGLRLGNYSDKWGAETALNNLVAKGVRGARVEPLPFGAVQHYLRAAKADAELQTRLKSLPPDGLGAGFQPCVNRPPPPATGG